MRNYRHFAVGMNANGSTIKRIFKPEASELGAYNEEWWGGTRLENPRFYKIELADGRVIKDTDLVVELPTSEVVH
jgi:hypothetical protein